MAYDVSEDWREKCYSGSSNYSCKLYLNDMLVPIEQIARIDINSPIIDNSSQDKPFYIGTFISQSITIKFQNLRGLNIASGTRVDLYIGQQIDDDTYEEIPIGKYLIDELSEDYLQTCEITCLDYAIKFASNCDYSSALGSNGVIQIDDLLAWICNYYDVELGDFPSTNGTVEIGSYDSTQSGKYYISCIAEIKGCNAKMDRDGSLTLIPLKSEPVATIDALESKSWELGEKYSIKQVTYFDAIRNFSFGSTSYFLQYNNEDLYYNNIFRLGFMEDYGNTLIIRQDNPFIVDETVVENIYNAVKDLEIWSLKCENYGDLSLDAWDIVTYSLGDKSYNTFYNNTTTYEMTVMSTNDVKIPNKQQEVTTNVVGGTQEQKIRRVSTEVNNIDGRITILAEEQNDVEKHLADIDVTTSGIITSVESTTSDVEELTKQVQTLQSDSAYQISVINSIQTNGVSTLKNTLVTIDGRGIEVATNTSKISTLMTNEKFVIQSSNAQIAFFGYDSETNSTKAVMDNLTVTNYFVAGYHRTEKIKINNNKRTGVFFVGGD